MTGSRHEKPLDGQFLNEQVLNEQFLNRDFLLSTETGRCLFHEVARDLPIVDLHNHLPAARHRRESRRLRR